MKKQLFKNGTPEEKMVHQNVHLKRHTLINNKV